MDSDDCEGVLERRLPPQVASSARRSWSLVFASRRSNSAQAMKAGTTKATHHVRSRPINPARRHRGVTRLLAPIRTLTVGPGISPDQPHDCSWGSRAVTAGRGFHPTLQEVMNLYFVCIIAMHTFKATAGPPTLHHSKDRHPLRVS